MLGSVGVFSAAGKKRQGRSGFLIRGPVGNPVAGRGASRGYRGRAKILSLSPIAHRGEGATVAGPMFKPCPDTFHCGVAAVASQHRLLRCGLPRETRVRVRARGLPSGVVGVFNGLVNVAAAEDLGPVLLRLRSGSHLLRNTS